MNTLPPELALPDHLRRVRGDTPKPRPVRWKRVRAQRPEGAKWETAERWHVHVPREWGGTAGDSKLAPGYRHLWVITGGKWTELRDAEAYIKVPTKDWDRHINRGHGKRVE